MEVLAPYKDIVAEADIQMPMPDEPPVPTFPELQSLPSPTPGEMNHPEHIQAATDHLQVWACRVAVVGNLLSHRNLLPYLSNGHYPPRHPAPLKAPTPPAPWILTDGHIAPYDDFKAENLEGSQQLQRRVYRHHPILHKV